MHINSVNEAEFIGLSCCKKEKEPKTEWNGQKQPATKKKLKKIKRKIPNNNGEMLNCGRNESNIQLSLLYYRMMYIALVHNTTRTKTQTDIDIEQIRNVNAKCKTSWRLIIINKSD